MLWRKKFTPCVYDTYNIDASEDDGFNKLFMKWQVTFTLWLELQSYRIDTPSVRFAKALASSFFVVAVSWDLELEIECLPSDLWRHVFFFFFKKFDSVM